MSEDNRREHERAYLEMMRKWNDGPQIKCCGQKVDVTFLLGSPFGFTCASCGKRYTVELPQDASILKV